MQSAVEFESSGKIKKNKKNKEKNRFYFFNWDFFYQLGIFGHWDWYRLPEVDIYREKSPECTPELDYLCRLPLR